MKKLILIASIAMVAMLSLSSCTAKPSKAEVRKALSEAIGEELGDSLPDDQKSKVDDYIECVVDEFYDDVSAKSLKKIVDAKNSEELSDAEGTEKEKEVMDAAATKCGEKFAE